MKQKIKIKVPVKDLENKDIYSEVENTIKNDPDNAYTVSGIMIQTFGVNETDILGKSFRDWKKGLPTLYGRIDRCLRRLVKEGKAQVTKDGKAWVYWWIQPKFIVGIKE